MRLLFFIIFFFASLGQTQSANLVNPEELSVQTLKSIFPNIKDSWGTGPFIIEKDPDEDPKGYTRLKISCLYEVSDGITIGTESYQYIYLESLFKKGAYNKKASFLSFFERHSITSLKSDSMPNFIALTKLFAAKPTAFPCETLSFFDYFSENKESYTISFIR